MQNIEYNQTAIVLGNKNISVGIVENDENYLGNLIYSLRALPYINSIRNWRSAEEFWSDGRNKKMDLIIIDTGLPGINGIDLAGLLTYHRPDLFKIILTSINNDEQIIQSLKYGCVGYIDKLELENMGKTIETIFAGGVILSPAIALQIMNHFSKTEIIRKQTPLTSRERQVLELMATGYKPVKVSELLDISLLTVRTHLRNIYQKLNLTNQQDLLRKAISLGISVG